MISIIIPTINPSLLKQLSENISENIGVNYEIISFENYKKNRAITKIYNYCAEKAQYDYLVFCHEDILFHTKSWGTRLIELLQYENIGLVGVAGSTYKSKHPAPWIFVPRKYYRTSAMSNIKNVQKLHINNPDNNLEYSEVKVLDGYFLASTKKNWERIKYDEQNIKGFHYYDIDYSLRQTKKVVVGHKIVIEHFSDGKFDNTWLQESIKYHKRKNIKTITVNGISLYEIKKTDIFVSRAFFLLLIKRQYSIFYTLFFLIQILLSDFFNKNNIRITLQFIKSIIQRFVKNIHNKWILIGEKIINKYLQKQYSGQDFCIISSNCWGGHVYHALNKKYNTPFVGLFINAPDFIKLLANFEHLMQAELKFKQYSKYKNLEIYYPIGLLPGDIEIHFMHYKSESEAYDKWNRRKKRLLKDKKRIFIKFDDMDFCEEKHIKAFHKLNYQNKISFTKIKYPFSENLKLKSPNDLILLYSTRALLNIPKWLNTGKITNSKKNRIINSIFTYPKSWTH